MGTKNFTFKGKAVNKVGGVGAKNRNYDSYINMNKKETFSQRDADRLSLGFDALGIEDGKKAGQVRSSERARKTQESVG